MVELGHSQKIVNKANTFSLQFAAGKGAWNSIGFMLAARDKYPQLQSVISLPEAGTSILKLSEKQQNKYNAAGTITIEDGRTYRITTGVNTIAADGAGFVGEDFCIEKRNIDKDHPEKQEFVLFDEKNPSRYTVLWRTFGKSFVIGKASEDSRVLSKNFNELFPDYAFAITYENLDTFKIESLEASYTQIRIKVQSIVLKPEYMLSAAATNGWSLIAHAGKVRAAEGKLKKFTLHAEVDLKGIINNLINLQQQTPSYSKPKLIAKYTVIYDERNYWNFTFEGLNDQYNILTEKTAPDDLINLMALSAECANKIAPKA